MKEDHRFLELEGLGLLPGERGLRSSEVTVRRGDVVLGLLEVEVLDDDSGLEREVGVDDGNELLVRLGRSSVRVDEDRERLGDTDGIRELDEDSLGETGGNEGLGDPSGSVGGRSSDGEVLSQLMNGCA